MGLFGSSGVSFTASKDIPSLAGKTILVTGGNAGLGKQSVHDLAKYGKPAKIFLAARSLTKAQSTIDEIKKDVPDANIVSLQLDLTSFDSIKAAARTFLSQSDRLDILMLNAGIMATPPGQTKEGYEIQFGTNHMGHFLLTKLLLPVLRATAARPEKPDVRIVVLTSAGLGLAPASGFDDSWVRTDGTAVNTLTRYGQSKLANALMARELSRRYPEITSVSVHPGVVNTNLADTWRNGGLLQGMLMTVARPFLTTPEMGARNQLWAAVSSREGVQNGEYYMPVGVVGWGRGTAKARDDELARRVWEWTEGELKGQEI